MKKDDGLAYTFMVAGVVLERDGKYLLVQEKKQSCYGKWNLPAGKVDEGYSIEETAVKEAKEETGFDVKLGEKIGIYHESVEQPVKHVFAAKIVGGELTVPEDELLDVKWFSLEEIIGNKENLREQFIIDAIKRYKVLESDKVPNDLKK